MGYAVKLANSKAASLLTNMTASHGGTGVFTDSIVTTVDKLQFCFIKGFYGSNIGVVECYDCRSGSPVFSWGSHPNGQIGYLAYNGNNKLTHALYWSGSASHSVIYMYFK